MLQTIDNLLQRSHILPAALHGIAVGIGPGSYTGTRTAIATAQALAFSLQRPLQGFCSLLSFVPAAAGRFAIVAAATADQVWVCQGMHCEDNLSEITIAIAPRSQLAAQIAPGAHRVCCPLKTAMPPPLYLDPLCRWLPTTAASAILHPLYENTTLKISH